MAIYFPSTQIQEVGSGVVSIPGTHIQHVEAALTGTIATTTVSSWIAINGTASITPTSASNSIYIYYNGCFRKDHTQGSWSLCMVGLYSDTAGTFLSHSGWNGSWRHTINSFRKLYIHSPGTTATQTYSLRFYNHDPGSATTTFYGNAGCAHDGYSFIRLVEVAA